MARHYENCEVLSTLIVDTSKILVHRKMDIFHKGKFLTLDVWDMTDVEAFIKECQLENHEDRERIRMQEMISKAQ